MERLTVRGEGLLLDLILWRRHGVRGRALVEQTLSLNPGLAGLGPLLPLGTEIILPDLPVQSEETIAVVSLFD